MKYLFSVLALGLQLAACGGRSERLMPVAGHGVDWMLHEDNEFLYVVATDIALDGPSSTLPSGEGYVARANAETLWLLNQEFALADGRLFCVRTSVDPPRVTQLRTPLPMIEGDTADELAVIFADDEVRECLGL